MRIHREGLFPILVALTVVVLHIIFFSIFNYCVSLFVLILLFLFVILFMVTRFFRVPKRRVNRVEDGIISPADGTVVAIEKYFENEYFKDERTKISIFMSINNVHVNSYPIDGVVEYVCHHPGRYFIAKLPKASFDNEHNSVVIKKDDKQIVLFRQIAGIVARRIVSYVQVGENVKQGEEMGIIRFGSRVDVFLPLNSQIIVNVGDKVRAKKSLLAYF